MQLQIHVENAIEHGLRNRKKSSYVKLSINETEKEIILLSKTTVEEEIIQKDKIHWHSKRITNA